MISRLLVAASYILFAAQVAPAQGILKGDIRVDGSSTVYLITEAMATTFKKLHPNVNISVGISGTGGGFKKFAAGETDICDASRKIKPGEVDACKKNNIEFVALQVAWDGLAVVVHRDNDWARKMTVDQLKTIWHPDMAAKKWSDVDPSWPSETIVLYGPGPDSGTFDYFTEAINGQEKSTRTDYTASEDDNTLVQGVSRNKYALGYFGLAYYEAHKDKLHTVAIAMKKGDPYVEPTSDTVIKNAYKPLSRPLYLYVKTGSLKRPEVGAFADFYLRRKDVVAAARYVPLSALQLDDQTDVLHRALGR
jgi:phosphate transport system substrate-binding protein